MSFNILNDVALYKLSNPKNKIVDLIPTKKKKNVGDRDPFFLLDPIGRLNILVQLIDKLKKEKKNYKYGTHSTSCC